MGRPMDTFLPALPLQMSYPLLFGVLLVAGMMGGELARLDPDLREHGVLLHRLRRERPVEVVDDGDGALEEAGRHRGILAER